MKYCHLNGYLTEQDQASIGLTDLGILRAYGIFDYFRFEERIPMFVEHHLDRFEHSSRKMLLQMPFSKKSILGFVQELIAANDQERGGIRLVLTGGYSNNGYTPGQNPNFFILQHPSTDYAPSDYKNGIKLLAKNYRREASEVKTINYITPLLHRKELEAEKAIDILYYKDFMISETSRANFFIVDANGHIATPDDFVLNGINRRIVMEIASDDFVVKERSIYYDELNDVKEAFITSTTKRIMPVTQIGETQIGNGEVGPVFRDLFKRFMAYEHRYINMYKSSILDR